mgnify:CR=1 FL=1
MKLVESQNKFIELPYITQAVCDTEVILASMQYFDKDGYELNHVEQLYHNHHNVDLSHDFLYHKANHVPWYTDADHSVHGVVLDHSMMMQRWAYTGAARKQIERLAKQKPELNKLLSVRPKWGFDLSIDYVYEGGAFELFHIEYDYYDYAEAVDEKAYYEEVISTIDWQGGVDDILRCKSEWKHLCSDDQADWKVQYFGFKRAFDNRKVFI